jgi:three-Cys-motif partner protein
MADMPDEYRGREHTWLKHRVLDEYLQGWAHKLGSIRQHPVHLWYVDCFAGPWQSQDASRSDTSIAIGLKALNDAAATWAALGNEIRLHAVFVEKDPRAFSVLQAFVAEAAGAVDVHALRGAFGDHVDAIDALIGTNPAFIFVDPTGWGGADLRFIAKLGSKARRDLMINVMYDHINRFKDVKEEKLAFLRSQMRDFFGLSDADLPEGLDEAALMGLYRDRLGRLGGIGLVADLAVPVPTRERTKFRLVVAGHNAKVIELFRDIEKKVIGADAARVRSDAKARADEDRTRQPALLQAPAPATDPGYADDQIAAEHAVRELLPRRLRRDGPQRFGDLWPRILCVYHLTLGDLRRVVAELRTAGAIEVRGLGPRERSVKDQHVLASTSRGPKP